MMMHNAKPWMTGLITAVSYFLVYLIISYSLVKELNFLGALVGAALIFCIYYAIQVYLNKKTKKKWG